MSDTLALDVPNWDIDLDVLGNLRTVGDSTPGTQTGPGMRMAQDVATRCRAWRGEVYFDTAQGINYPQYLGQAPMVSQLQTDFQTEALLVPDVQSALANFDLARTTRQLTGSITLSDQAGNGAQVEL